MNLFIKNKKAIFELMRYCVVGGISAVIDLLGLAFFTEVVFGGDKSALPLTISTAAGFILGLITNYCLSMVFVFISPEQREKNKEKAKTFMIFSVVGVIGLILTELLMHLGMLFVKEEGFWYLLLSCFVKGAVLIWNYIGRKIFVYRGK